MSIGARAALFVGAFASAVFLGAGLRIASAQASNGPQPPDSTAGIVDYANSEVDAAMAEANAAASQVGVQLPVTSSTPAVQEPLPAPEVQAQPPPSMGTSQPFAAAETDPVVVLSASPQTTPPPPPPGAAVLPPGLADLVRGELERATAGPKRGSHTSRSIVSRKGYLRVELRTSATATSETSSSSATSIARSTVRSSVKSSGSGSGGGSQRNAPPKAPLPFPPFPPNAPAPPNTGASSAGGGGGQGALLIFSVVLGALVFLGIHHLLRKVHWSDLRMPGRGASLPWKPG